MTQPRPRRVAIYPNPFTYPVSDRHQRVPSAQAFTRQIEREQLEEWIEKLEARCEEHPDLTLKAHTPYRESENHHGKLKVRDWKTVGKVRDKPQDPTVCVVRVSKTTGIVCFYSEATELEPLSEELPIAEACEIANQMEKETT